MKYFLILSSFSLLLSCSNSSTNTEQTITLDTTQIELFESTPIDTTSIKDTIKHASYSPLIRTAFLTQLTKALDSKSLKSLYRSLKELKTDSLDYPYRISKNRTIISTYNEVQVNINVEKIITKNPLHYFNFPYELRIIANKDKIITYSLYESSTNKESITSYTLIETKFIDDSVALKKLNEVYQLNYHSNLNIENLFVSNIVYGANCGFTGAKTKYQKLLEKLIESKDTSQLTNWLKSGNTELQVYAIKGFHQLSKSNTSISIKPTTQKMIDLIKQKEGDVYTCSGCMHMNRSIKDIISSIEN